MSFNRVESYRAGLDHYSGDVVARYLFGVLILAA